MRTRRKPGVVWLPRSIDNAIGSNTNIIETAAIDITGPVGTTVSGVAPIVLDSPFAAGVAGEASLADFEQSAYRLRRIVGKVWVATSQFTDAATQDDGMPTAFVACAGFIILRVDQNGVPLKGTTGPEYNPLLSDSERDPWIWRRSWALSARPLNNVNLSTTPSQIPARENFPASNAEYGSVQDGPHVDAKTARTVRDEERLFIVVSAIALNGTSDQLTHTLQFYWDLRVLASMLKTAGNRRNASR